MAPCGLPFYLHWSLRLTSFFSHLLWFLEGSTRAPTSSITTSRWSTRVYLEPWLTWDFLNVFNHFIVVGSETPSRFLGLSFSTYNTYAQSSFCPQLNLMARCFPVMSSSSSACLRISLLACQGLPAFSCLNLSSYTWAMRWLLVSVLRGKPLFSSVAAMVGWNDGKEKCLKNPNH